MWGKGFYSCFDESPLCLQERYRKALADSENVRRRTQKFVEDAKLFGEQKSCVYCTGLPASAENVDQQLFCLSIQPCLIYFKACSDVWPGLLISEFNHCFFSVSSCVLSYQVYRITEL